MNRVIAISAATLMLFGSLAASNQQPVGFGAAVTGGAGGQTVQATTNKNFIEYCTSADPLIIEISGKIELDSSVSLKSNKTLKGVGPNAEITKTTLILKNISNVIIQNLKIHHAPTRIAREQDLVSLEGTTKVWLDHCELYNAVGDANGDGVLQDTGESSEYDNNWYDGSFDAKKASTDITISWCYFHDAYKTSLLGSGKADTLMRNAKITYHHNIFWNVKSRCPSIRFGTGHIFNNYFGNVIETGINTRLGAKVLIERNVFEEVGSGKKDLKCILELEEGPIGAYYDSLPGFWDVKENVFTDCKGHQPTTSNCTLAIAYDYSSILQTASTVKDTVLKKAGTESGVTLTPKYVPASIRNPLLKTNHVDLKNIQPTGTFNALGARVLEADKTSEKAAANGMYLQKDKNGAKTIIQK